MLHRIWKAIRRTFSSRYSLLKEMQETTENEIKVLRFQYAELPDKRVLNGPRLRKEIEHLQADLLEINQDLRAYE